jgi:hypothetical protein
MTNLIHEVRNHEYQADNGVDEYGKLVRKAEGQEIDDEAGDGLKEQQAADDNRQTGALFIRSFWGCGFGLSVHRYSSSVVRKWQ